MFVKFINANYKQLLSRERLINLLMYTNDREVDPGKDAAEVGVIYVTDIKYAIDNVKYVTYLEGGERVVLKPHKKYPSSPFSIYTHITLHKGDLPNVNGTIETTIGRYLLNVLLLVDPYGDVFDYHNDVWDVGQLESKMYAASSDGKITAIQYHKYVDNGYFIGHFAELGVPTFTAKSASTNPKVKARKKELLTEHADAIAKGDATTMVAIERELITLDKEWIKGDPAERYYGATAGKSYNLHRKEIFLVEGARAGFSDDKKVVFMDHSLDDGIDPKNIETVNNSIRSSSYDRGKETAKGGVGSKYIFRAMEDLVIKEDDCGTKRVVNITFGPIYDINAYIGRTVNVNGKLIVINEDNKASLIGKPVGLRSPTMCETVDGKCYVCMGEKFRVQGIKRPGPRAAQITSTYMNKAMKSMHGNVLSTKKINVFDHFVN